METLLYLLERLVFWEQTFCVFCKLFVIYIWIDLCSPEYLIVWWLLKLLFDIHYLFGLLNIYIWKSLNYFMVFKPVHVFSYICYLIWPRREDHHGIRCIHASFTSLFALEHLHWYWDGGDQYICWVARLPFSGLWWCGLSSPCSTVPCILDLNINIYMYIYYLNWFCYIWNDFE